MKMIKKIYNITEQQLRKLVEKKGLINELVYINKYKTKGNKAFLSYDSSGSRYHTDNLTNTDTLKTDKMEQSNGDTYEVPLKNGIISYNITSIQGTEVMHYFKRYWDSQKTEFSINGKPYELSMENSEFNRFIDAFKRKVWYVIEHCINQYKSEGDNFKPIGISILPVQSSSNFNTHMANILSQTGGINGLPCQVINSSLFVKDLRNLQKDTNFINKNKDYYNNSIYSDGTGGSVLQNVDKVINKNSTLAHLYNEADKLVRQSTILINNIYNYTYSLNNVNQGDSDMFLNRLVKNYKKFYDMFFNIKNKLSNAYENPLTGGISRINTNELLQPIKGTKPQSVAKRSQIAWNAVKPYLKGDVCPATGEPYKPIEIYQYQRQKFQIKNLSNAERMGLKNIYNTNTDTELVKKELDKINGTVFVVFDDNVSGGATLSDICYNAIEAGIEHIVPITFGKMREKNYVGMKNISIPINTKGEKGFNF